MEIINQEFEHNITASEMHEYRQYLNELRRYGACNMWGASAYLIKYFNLEKKVAKYVLKFWMENFEEGD